MPANTRHSIFPQPSDANATIWRYLDFAKLVSLLEMRALFFARADQLGDPFEGSIPKCNPQLSTDVSAIRYGFTQCTFMNCWYLRAQESQAMWQLYAKHEYGVAIQSTYGRLVDCLPSHRPPIFVGMVTYIDYDNDQIADDSTFLPFLHKRQMFEHEHEVRAVIQDMTAMTFLGRSVPKEGTFVNVDLPTLIDKIYVAPGAPDWFASVVERLSERYEIPYTVVRSRLNEPPHY